MEIRAGGEGNLGQPYSVMKESVDKVCALVVQMDGRCGAWVFRRVRELMASKCMTGVCYSPVCDEPSPEACVADMRWLRDE